MKLQTPSAGTTENARIDLWLKHVCLFKHRVDATEACKGGLVKLNGNRTKPAASIKPGDVVEITGDHYRKVVVLDIPRGNVAKPVARTMYREETPEQPTRDVIDLTFGERDRGTGRPTKRDRRDMDKWKW
jgi:ribosome-associated heat shock protein Hsp15